MKTFILLSFIFVNTAFSQENDTISVLIQSPKSKLISFQFDFFKKVIEIYNLKHKNKLIYRLIPFSDSEEIYSKLKTYYKKKTLIIGINATTIYDGTEEYRTYFRYSLPYLPVKTGIIGKELNQFKKYKQFSIVLVDIEPYRI